MRINTIVTLGASAAFGVMSIILARGWINDAVSAQFASAPSAPATQSRPAIETMPVLVADIDLRFGDQLEPQSLRLVDMPRDMVPAGTFQDYALMFGDGSKPTVVLTQMRANEPVLDYKISGPGGRGSLSVLIKDGHRAASVRVNAVAGVSGFVLPGDHVDVILTRDIATAGQDRTLSSDVLLQNVKVLGADQNSDTTSSEVNVVGTVTLEVTPRDAQRLALATDLGTLSLTLRQNGETVIAPVAGLTEKNLTASAVKPARNYYKRPVSAKRPVQVSKPQTTPTAKVNIIRSGVAQSVSVRVDGGDVETAQTKPETLAGEAKG